MLTLSNRLNHLKIAYHLILIRFLRILFMKKSRVDTLLKTQIMKAQVKHGPVFFYYLILF